MKHAGLILVFLFLIPIADAQSSQPSPGVFPDQTMNRPPNQETPNSKQEANAQKNNSKESESSFKQKNANYTKQKTENNYKERQNNAPKTWNVGDKIAVIASIAAFLQFAALIITIFVMIRNSRRQLRAYVFPENITLLEGGIMNPPQTNHLNEPGIVLLIKNSGQTPAYGVISWVKINVIEPINEAHLTAPKLLESFSVNDMGSGGVISKAIWFGRSLATNELEDIRKTVRAIYVHGRIEYRDAFKKKRYTNFRLSYTGEFPRIAGMMLVFCEKGNKAN